MPLDLFVSQCQNLGKYLKSISDRLWAWEKIQKSNWKSILHRINKELQHILLIGNNAHSGYVVKGRELYLRDLENFRVYNCFGQTKEVFPRSYAR